MTLVLTAVGAICVLGMLLAARLRVEPPQPHPKVDPRIDRVDAMLPHADCGACGLPGCHVLAEALVAGRLPPRTCRVATEIDCRAIADYLGVEVGVAERRVARRVSARERNLPRQLADRDGSANRAASPQGFHDVAAVPLQTRGAS